MNVLHINQSDIVGGAGIAGYCLHQGLLAEGISSHLLVGEARSSSRHIAAVPRYRLENQILRITKHLGINHIHYISTFNLAKHTFYKNVDVINFHNLHTGYFNYLAIPALTKNKPAVFTLHDMWSFTGHCAYSYDCDRWRIGCGKCPHPDTYPAIQRDNTRLEWKLKNWVYSNSNLTIVTPSRWLTERVKQSMLSRLPIHHIPYGIDTEAYQSLDPEQCRSVLGIPIDKKVLMFGAASVIDPRKGGDLLLKALASLPTSLKSETVLLTIGDGGEEITKRVGVQAMNLGYVSNTRLKSIAYSAADLFVFPTRADNLPLMLLESMACGTPIVSFKLGGIPDLVRPGITGYLAKPEDTKDFCSGILQLLENRALRDCMSQQCYAIARSEYSVKRQARTYIDLYRQVLQTLGAMTPSHLP